MVTATEHSYKDLELINPGLSHDCLVKQNAPSSQLLVRVLGKMPPR